MTDPKNNFMWYELMTTDTDAAAKFYGAVIGWGAQDSGVPDANYTLFMVEESGVAGLMDLPQDVRDAGGRPSWIGYIMVDDVDAYVERITAAGGKVHRAPEDVPDMLRFAVVADPHGAVFSLLQPLSPPPEKFPTPGSQGTFGWSELHAGDGPQAFDFYSRLFGWTKDFAMDMGDMGVYQTYAVNGAQSGGIMTKMADTPMPMWVYYINVDGINAAVERVKENGGQVIMGPHEVPGNRWIVQGLDPQGALFALLSNTA